MIDNYYKIQKSLPTQVQKTSGIYSFYYAIRILREIDPTYPEVPFPKKSSFEHSNHFMSAGNESLRHFAKNTLHSGQGEILSEQEMSNLVTAHGYAAHKFDRHNSAKEKKLKFLTECIQKKYPVIVSHRDEHDGLPRWVLIIGYEDNTITYISPANPLASKKIDADTLLRLNADADDIRFPSILVKEVTNRPEGFLKTGMKFMFRDAVALTDKNKLELLANMHNKLKKNMEKFIA